MKVKKDWKKGKAILALGEVSGHHHRIESVYYKENSITGLAQEVLLEEPKELLHEEHDSILIPVGEYEIKIQQEYDIIDGIRQVLD